MSKLMLTYFLLCVTFTSLFHSSTNALTQVANLISKYVSDLEISDRMGDERG